MSLFMLWLGIMSGNFIYTFLVKQFGQTAPTWEQTIERSYFQGVALLIAGIAGFAQ